MKKFALVLTFIAALSLTIFADVRLPDNMRPKPSVSPTPEEKDVRVPININVSPNVKEPVLRVSRGTLEKLNNAAKNEPTSAAGFFNSPQTPTLMSGAFLSLALIFGGVWFARGKSFSAKQKTAIGVLVIGFLAASGLTVYANVAPPPYQGVNGTLFSDKMRSHYYGAVDTAKVEITNDENIGIELIVPEKR